ncbi:uncharacterized protein BYT42DRAFT_206838 [Radiomyces spectabilis]|uniref:uncharacterized protein n=1 Tax=Radiomyces spectabilis TaxID=64574 RepID=UPI0022203383|nr:uncharacterized protein BYT42DRAFT_206838 [Radiomyces spectabilis]KAI8391749.1 hypothetical protein BYT42DRAFT_206838 [Radiomyces spectabilis]
MMQRLARVWNTRPFPLHSRRRLRCYTTVTETPIPAKPSHPMLTAFRKDIQHSKADVWQRYQQLQSQREDVRRLFDHDDFIALRSQLWKKKTWGVEDRVLQVLEDMKELGHPWTILEYNEFFLVKLYQARYNDILEMYHGQFRQDNMKLSIGSFNAILATFIELDNIEEAVKLIKDAPTWDIIPDIRDFERTVHRSMPRNKTIVAKANRLIIDHGCCHSNVLNSNLVHLFREKRTADALRVYGQRKKAAPLDISTYGVMLRGLIDHRQLRDAQDIFSDLKKAGLQPNPFICTSMLTIYAHQRDIPSAEQLIKDTVLAGHKLDVQMFNQLIKVYFKARKGAKALQAFGEIQRHPDLQVNDVIVNTMINGLVINHEMKAANILYQQMLQSNMRPDIVTFNTLFKGFINSHDYVSAGKVIADMARYQCEPDVVTLTTMVDVVCKTQEPPNTESLIKLLQSTGMSPNAYTFNGIINHWVRQQRMDEAEHALSLMKSAPYQLQPTIHTYTNLIQGYVNTMNLSKAMETFQSLLRSGTKPDRATFNFMITAFVDHDRLEDAVTCLLRMCQMKLNPTKDTWRILLEECSRRENWEMGKTVVQALETNGFEIHSKGSLERAYMTVKNRCK